MTDLPTLPLAGLLGIEIVEATPDKVVARMLVRPDLCTAGDILHGGAYTALRPTNTDGVFDLCYRSHLLQQVDLRQNAAETVLDVSGLNSFAWGEENEGQSGFPPPPRAQRRQGEVARSDGGGQHRPTCATKVNAL